MQHVRDADVQHDVRLGQLLVHTDAGVHTERKAVLGQ